MYEAIGTLDLTAVEAKEKTAVLENDIDLTEARLLENFNATISSSVESINESLGASISEVSDALNDTKDDILKKITLDDGTAILELLEYTQQTGLTVKATTSETEQYPARVNISGQNGVSLYAPGASTAGGTITYDGMDIPVARMLKIVLNPYFIYVDASDNTLTFGVE